MYFTTQATKHYSNDEFPVYLLPVLCKNRRSTIVSFVSLGLIFFKFIFVSSVTSCHSDKWRLKNICLCISILCVLHITHFIDPANNDQAYKIHTDRKKVSEEEKTKD